MKDQIVAALTKLIDPTKWAAAQKQEKTRKALLKKVSENWESVIEDLG